MRLLIGVVAGCTLGGAQVPKVWEDKELSGWALPVAGLGVPPGHFFEREYYAAPAATYLRTYPVYFPDREPAGYWDSLQKRSPEPLMDAAKLRSPGDWIEAGRRAFQEMDVSFFRSRGAKLIASVRSGEGLKDI